MKSQVGLALILVGLLLIIYPNFVQLQTVGLKVTVKDSVTQQPIKGAYLMLICSFRGGGTMPAEGHTNDEGVVYINTQGMPVISWHITASGYLDASGSGSPPATILMVPVKPPPTYTIEITQIICEGLNQQITVNGKITPAIGGKQITLTIQYPSGKTETRYFLNKPDGTFTYTDPALIANEKGNYIIQAKVDTAASEPKTLTIEAQLNPTLTWTTQQTIGLTLILFGLVLVMARKRY